MELGTDFTYHTCWKLGLPINLRIRGESSVLGKYICPSFVRRTNTDSSLQQVSSVSTHIVLTARKAISLCFSVWWFGNGWNAKLALGAAMVFTGSILYTTGTTKEKRQ